VGSTVSGTAGAQFGELEGRDDWRRFNELRSFTPAPGGELMLEVQQRAVAALLALRARFPDGRVVVVSHGDVIRGQAGLYHIGGFEPIGQSSGHSGSRVSPSRFQSCSERTPSATVVAERR
jgi:broad specificity phosphatase PhoE